MSENTDKIEKDVEFYRENYGNVGSFGGRKDEIRVQVESNIVNEMIRSFEGKGYTLKAIDFESNRMYFTLK